MTLHLLEGTTDALRQALKRREIRQPLSRWSSTIEVDMRHIVSDGAYLIGPADSKVVRGGRLI